MSGLRLYQANAIAAVIKSWMRHQSVLGVSPTGTGKTRIAVSLLRDVMRPGQKALWLTHTRKLTSQSARALAKQNFFVSEFANGNKDLSGQVVVATWQSAIRSQPLVDTHFTFVVVDEAHRFITPYTLALVRHFMKRKDVRVIGITATAMRDDARPLSVLFPKVAFDFTLSRRSFERQGWLARPIVTDERNIVNVKDVYKIWRKRTKGCKTIAFASTLDVARACAAYFRQKGVDACVIDASTKPADREVLETCQVIFNVGIYIEGADIPGVEAILEVNSTRSPVSFVQKAGRALRGDSKVARIIRCNPGAYSFRLK